MSKKDSLNSSNTLFNYFARSPVTQLKSSPSTPTSSKSVQKKDDTPKTAPNIDKGNKKRGKDNNSTVKKQDHDDEAEKSEDEIRPQKKKRRILAMDDGDDDSEEENSQDKVNKAETPNKSFLAKNFEFQGSTPKAATASTTATIEEEDYTPTKKKSKKNEVIVKEELFDEPTVFSHMKLEFLKPNKIKDAQGRRPDHPDYDSRTLHVPESHLSGLTPAMRQWWIIKSKHFDCVLFFKVGKFYELYHMDATVGVTELGFSYMKGDFAHSGFPETAYDRMSTNLVERGYKVARIEQTETPDMMQERCRVNKTNSKFDKVVKREVCQVTIKGTEVFGQQVQMTFNHQPKYMMAIVEKKNSIGICFIDTSIGEFHLGEFSDDLQSSRLLTLLSHYPPTLVLFERNALSTNMRQTFKTVLCNVKKEPLTTESQFWGAEKTLKYLAENFYRKNEAVEWPKLIRGMQSEDDQLGLTPSKEYTLALKALGGCIWYLKQSLLDQQVVSLAHYKIYIPPDTDFSKENVKIIKNVNRYMVLDSITLSNLKITGEEQSLMQTLDHCCTKFGKRLLNTWVCSPSCEIDIILQRQAAVTELLEASALLQDVRLLLGALPDLERQLAQIHTFGNQERSKNHPDGRAILYEEKTYGKKKIQDFITTLNAFESLLKIPKLFEKCESKLLKFLTQLAPVGGFPEMKEQLDFFKSAFDHEEALKNGVIAPESGVDDEYDSIEREIKGINDELDVYLKEQEKYFGCRLSYFGTDKKRFQLEVPESNAKKAGSGYQLETQKKGKSKRFHTEKTREFLKKMLNTEDQKKTVLKDLSRRVFGKFSAQYTLWKTCVDQVAILDVLTSLAEYAKSYGNTCVPDIVESDDGPILEIEDGTHPCMTESEDFIPNGIILGGQNSPLALLTGPNMGGKSTLMRQMGLLTVMAQIGCRIPAQSCRMSIVDRIFTRLGANDDIMAGHSTFLVELNETSAILKHATENSLVLLDELGRGTATYDGTAIAGAVVNFLADLKCRSMFSTHYHNLVDNFHTDPRIYLGHMACMVENESEDDPTQETVTFLYKYTEGPCPKSYGFNAAKLAGMPNSIIKRAHELSKKVEATALRRKLFTKMLKGAEKSEIKDLLIKLKACSL